MSQNKGPFEKYGIRYIAGTTALAIELDCYRTNHGPEAGGLGAEQHFRNAFKLAWPNFIWHDWMEMLTTAFCEERFVTVVGHTRATKTYGAAHLLYLDYCADPLQTWTSLTTVTFEGLKSRMWSDLMTATETASFKCPFSISSTSNEMKMRIKAKGHRGDEKYQMEGFATSTTKNSAGRIQGKHANRRRLALDEAQELPPAIWTAEVNAASAPDFKSFRLANPVERASDFGRECEPKGGWLSIHDTDLSWRNKAGHLVLHFDALQNHNSKLYFRMERGEITKPEYEAKKLPFMCTYEYAMEVKAQKGENSLEWWMYIRGFFPTDGIVKKPFGQIIIERMKKDIDFDFRPKRGACLDAAYEGDDCVMHFFDYGIMRDGGMGIQFVNTVKVPIDAMHKEKTKDEQISDFVVDACKTQGVSPEDYIMDTTGNGRSIYSHMARDWSRVIESCSFAGAPTDRLLIKDGKEKCEDVYCYFVDELWFRAAAWGQEGRVGGLNNLAVETIEDLNSRRATILNKKDRLESKKELKKRLGRSPDYGDAFVLATELLARRGFIPSGFVNAKPSASAWDEQRKRALRACKVYDEAREFAHD